MDDFYCALINFNYYSKKTSTTLLDSDRFYDILEQDFKNTDSALLDLD